MKEIDSVLLIQNYGRIKIKLREQLDSKGITRNYLARKIDTRFEVVDKWYNDQVDKIDADILARICFVLKCHIEDIIEYVDTSENK